MPRSARHFISSARRHAAAGRLQEAILTCHAARRGHPHHVGCRIMHMRLRIAQWGCNAAVSRLVKMVHEAPNEKEYALLISALRRLGRAAEASEWAREAADRSPTKPLPRYIEGCCYLDLGEYRKAERCFQTAIEMDGQRASFHEYLGVALLRSGRAAGAVTSFVVAARLDPRSSSIQVGLANALLLASNGGGAITCATQAVELDPGSVPARMCLAQALLAEGRTAEGLEQAVTATELDPEDGYAAGVLGLGLQMSGEMSEAVAVCERAIDLEPRQGLAYFSIVRAHRVTSADSEMVDRMHSLSDDPGIDIRSRELLEYALGKAYEDLGSFAKAMGHYENANKLAYLRKFGDAPFEDVENRRAYIWTKQTYGEKFLRRHRLAGTGHELPIFVVGMVRSGTTLVEQILSAHPAVGGAGEQSFWPVNGGRAFNADGRLDPESLRELAKQYVGHLESLCPGKRFVVDKMPGNYLSLGLLHLAFPNARVVHVNRNPRDCCFSIYSTENSVLLPWMHVKANIATNYRNYLDLMDHWRSVLPRDRIFELQYEDLVADPEAVCRKLLAYCGLPWSEACLKPHENPRGVVTPSLWQVRQPIYKTSVERWRNFEPWLQEFLEFNT